MQKNTLTQNILILIIVVSIVVSGYIILYPKNATTIMNQNSSGLAPMVDGKQVIKTMVMASSYNPSYFKVKSGTPVRFEATSSGQPGCGSGAIISKLFDNTFYLDPSAGALNTKEFTPQNPGKYTFSCTMGMIRGTIEVIE